MTSEQAPGGRVLGIWDGHDSGAALCVDGQVVVALNEERFTRRKLEITFPDHSIRHCLAAANLKAEDIDTVAFSTGDPARTLTRYLPGVKERYRRIRRREVPPGAFAPLLQGLKWRVAAMPPNALSRSLSRRAISAQLLSLGLNGARLDLHDHHACHAMAAARASGLDACAVVTIDGVGDGASATVSHWHEDTLKRLATTSSADSLGVFFERVTHLLNMRELEDEGKVMALADHAAPVPDELNPLLEVFELDGLVLRMAYRGRALDRFLARVLYRFPNEQFAFMAQRAVEDAGTRLAVAATQATGERDLALAGGVVSNVKMNRAIRLHPEINRVRVFPHMGDGGLALGAALLSQTGAGPLDLGDLDLGTDLDLEKAAELLSTDGRLVFEKPADLATRVGELLGRDQVVLWCEGRMEYGPRALGRRSVLARPDRRTIRDRLNLVLKRRVWYQPFCPSMLESTARRHLEDWDGHLNRHMTMSYKARPESRERLAGVLSVDGTCRPQILPDDADHPLVPILHQAEQRFGIGALLDTSLNIHGEPLVRTEEEAIDVLLRSGADALVLGPLVCRIAPEVEASEPAETPPPRAPTRAASTLSVADQVAS